MTMTLVSTVTVGLGGAASIDFTSLPQTGTDLLIVLSARPTGTEADMKLRFNSDSANNYSYRRLWGSGSAAASNTASSQSGIVFGYTRSDYTASTFTNTALYIPNYSAVVAKSVSSDTVAENNATAANLANIAGLWSGTAAVTTVTLIPEYGTSWAQYSTASLYTITKGSGGASVS